MHLDDIPPTIVPSAPLFVYYESGRLCNLSCRFCQVSAIPVADEESNLSALFDEILFALNEADVFHIQFTGGEPFIDPELPRFLRSAYSCQIFPGVITNAFQVPKEVLSALLDTNGTVGVSVHGATPETHDTLVRKKGAFRATVKNIKRIATAGVEVVALNFTATSVNFRELHDFVALFVDILGDNFRVNVDRFLPVGAGRSKTELILSKNNLIDLARQMIKAEECFGIPVRFGDTVPYCLLPREATVHVGACSAGTHFCYIDKKGDIRLCSASLFIVGNLLANPLKEIWKSDVLVSIRSPDSIPQQCRTCSHVVSCMGGCRFSDMTCLDDAVDPYLKLWGFK